MAGGKQREFQAPKRQELNKYYRRAKPLKDAQEARNSSQGRGGKENPSKEKMKNVFISKLTDSKRYIPRYVFSLQPKTNWGYLCFQKE